MMTPNKNKRLTKISYVLKLSEISRGDIERVGAKAANLGELLKSGFPVPDGFVLTTAAFKRFLKANNINDASPSDTDAAVLPVDITDVLLKAAAELGDVMMAVRSSGVAEDLPDASFAGQYETVLNVRGKEALLDAVRRCWSSAFNERVLSYRRAQGKQGTPEMAVLVQRLIQADASGVAFTANPVTGERETTVVNAIRGLGERLVSGRASPDQWLVKGNRVTRQTSPEGAIDADQARTVSELARRVEAHYGAPQDIEWAYAGGRLFLLQSRPITALPEELPKTVAVRAEPPPGFWQRDNHIPEPVMPISRTLHFEAFNKAWRQCANDFGMLIDGIEYRIIGGWLYIRNKPLGGKEGPPPPAWLLAILARLLPLIRSRIKKSKKLVRSDRAGQIIRLWYDEWKPSRIARITQLQEVDMHCLSDDALYEHITSLASFFRESGENHIRLSVIAVPLAKLTFTCRDILGWNDAQALELLSGLSERSSEPANRLNELASMAADRPDLITFLKKGEFANIDSLDEIDPEFAAAFHAYKHEFGCRGLQYGFHEPTLAERPDLILSLIRDQIARGFDIQTVRASLDEKRNTALQRARAELVSHSAQDREQFESALAKAELAYPVREDNVYYNHNVPFGLMRYGLLELGRRFLERGQLADRDDIFFLEIDEALLALKNGGDLQERVARRKAEYAWAKEHPGPATYGKAPGPPPSFAGLPAEVQFMYKAFIWYSERVFVGSPQSKRQPQESLRLSGIAASSGKYTGPVRIIMDESEFDRIRAGDVLVCPITSPTWSIIFPSVGALVTDAGGILSHPAIIAREYGLPAVVATGQATSLLHNDQSVTVDGSAGIVEVNV